MYLPCHHPGDGLEARQRAIRYLFGTCTGTCTRTRTVSRVPRTVAVIVDYSLLQTRNCYSNYSALQHVTAAHASPFEGLLVTAITACYSITALQQLQRLQYSGPRRRQAPQRSRVLRVQRPAKYEKSRGVPVRTSAAGSPHVTSTRRRRDRTVGTRRWRHDNMC